MRKQRISVGLVTETTGYQGTQYTKRFVRAHDPNTGQTRYLPGHPDDTSILNEWAKTGEPFNSAEWVDSTSVIPLTEVREAGGAALPA